MGTLVHLGAEDGLLEASARLAKASADGDAVLVVPEGAPALASPLFLRTLREQVGDRELVLVTSDAGGRALASGEHVPAYASVSAYEQRRVDATEELEKHRLDAIAHIGRERRRQRAVRRRTLVAIALASALMLAFVPSAEVTVAGEEATIGAIELDVNASRTSPTIPARIFAGTLSVLANGTSTGVRSDKTKATGMERFSNVSTDRLDIAAGTLVWTSSNVQFRTTQAKSIAPSTFFPFLVNEVQIPIEAVEAGTSGNVSRGEIRNVADKRLRVTNDAATSGGDEKTVALVATSDYTAAASKLDQAIDAAVRQQLAAWKGTLADGERLEDHYTAKTTARTTSGDVVGKETPTFTLSAAIELTAYGVPSGEPRTSAVRELTRLLPPEHELVPESISVDIPSVRFNADGLTWHVVASARHRPRLDEGALQLALAGQDREAAAKLLEPHGMKLVELHAYPSWWPRLPLLPLRIGVRAAVGS